MADWLAIVASLLGGGAAAGAAFYIVGRRVQRGAAEAAARAAAVESARVLEEARQRMVLAAKEEVLRAREAGDEEVARRRREIDRREQGLEERVAALEERDRGLERRGRVLEERERALAATELEARARLERIAGLTAQEAKQELLRRLEDEARGEAAALARDLKEQAKRNADKEAQKILALAIQRLAAEHTAESTVSAVALPSDEMKGRIIGREGRNIRAFEAATGVDVIIDDTPDTVVVSCFDPVRREVGRLALERLITDGRIHPGRIEEVVDKARAEVDASVLEAGEQGVFETVINCIAAHHDDVAHESPISVIVQAADAVSGSRPGARREAFETYVKRLTQLEQIASEFAGVEKVFAIQAGREVRVVVTPNAIDDGKASELSEQIARKIERELQYPGQIKVVVIRETRAVDFAR